MAVHTKLYAKIAENSRKKLSIKNDPSYDKAGHFLCIRAIRRSLCLPLRRRDRLMHSYRARGARSS